MRTIFNKSIISLLLLTNALFPMSPEDADLESASSGPIIKVEDYYHQDTKTLDMSNIPLKNNLLNDLIGNITALIRLTGAENLILENNKLENIPYELITFALTNKTLKYVSFKNNKFKIQNGSEFPEAIDKLLEKAMGKNKTRERSNTIGGIMATLWDGISPEIEKAIEKSNKIQDKKIFFKKIIIIDRRIPPITIIDQDKLPKDTKTKCKDVFIKILYIGSGIVVTLIPTLITYLMETSSCDLNQLNSMMLACNLNNSTI